MVDVLPEVSVACAEIVCRPFNIFCVLSENDQLVVPVAVTGVPPSTLICTLATAILSAAVPVIDTVPTRVAPLVGKLMDTVGGVKSMTPLVEVTK